ncbi:uncharacterized protein LOC143375491 [Andrena cerasifolii]|uniref:uncharacterized protein LOC143375491 n=1 Tax=Andrena cerasifolii TaxID=2819439 RepID=UPI004037D94D
MACSFPEKLKLTKLATKYQQNFYELLPDWFQYSPDEYPYIKQNIGFGLFGPSQADENKQGSASQENCPLNINDGTDIFNRVVYDKESCKIINTIYEKIITYGTEDKSSPIHVGIIYNVTLNHTVVKKSQKNTTNSCNEVSNRICPMAVFKIMRLNSTWYIDNEGRIYKSWVDYLNNNKLPKCTMVVPKDGVYQSNPYYKITEQSSMVWIEEKDSPACAVKNKILNVCDNVSNVVSVGTFMGLGIASFVTPVLPVLTVAGGITLGVSGLYNIGRKSRHLLDRHRHKESISPLNKDALPAWLEIAGTTLTIGANGGSMLLSRAIARGRCISSVSKLTYNTLIIGNLTVNGVGIVYQGCRLMGKYKSQMDVDRSDVLVFISQILFFSNTLLTAKLAGELIRSSKGTILEKFQNTLRVNRLQKEFDRTKEADRNNVGNNCKGIICRLKRIINKEDFLGIINKISQRVNCQLKFENGKIMVNNITLLDPLPFACHLLTMGAIRLGQTKSDSLSVDNNTDDITTLLSQLLDSFYAGEQSAVKKELPDISDFNDILDEIRHMRNATDILTKIFKISATVLQHCNDPGQFLVEAIYFVWEYSKANLKQHGINACSSFKGSSSLYNALTKIVTVIYEIIDNVASELFSAFYTYMLNTEPLSHAY